MKAERALWEAIRIVQQSHGLGLGPGPGLGQQPFMVVPGGGAVEVYLSVDIKKNSKIFPGMCSFSLEINRE